MMNLALLALPVGGLWGLRLYESALVRQTEAELIAEGATVAALYRTLWRAAGGDAETLGPPVNPRWTHRPGFDQPWLPRTAVLDLAEAPLLPPPPEAEVPAGPADGAALRTESTLDLVLRDVQLEILAGVRVVDRSGIVVATSGEEQGKSLVAREEVRRALLGEPVSLLRRRGNGRAPSALSLVGRGSAVRVFVALPVIEGDRVIGVVVASRTPGTVGEALAEKRWHLAGLVALLLAFAGALSTLGTVAVGRPLRAVTARAKRAADGARGAMAVPGRPVVREVAELSEALSRMVATLEQRADYIRDFATHVSHEFKTPLATIAGTVELLRDHLAEMSEAERDRFLGNLDAEARRLARLVARLLDLARADVAPAAGAEHCRPAALIARLAPGIDAEIDDLDLRIGAEAFETILGNLLDNARRHGGQAVFLSLRADRDEAVLTSPTTAPASRRPTPSGSSLRFTTTTHTQGGTGSAWPSSSLVTAHGGTIGCCRRNGARCSSCVCRCRRTRKSLVHGRPARIFSSGRPARVRWRGEHW